jgi:cytochrome d ubiquinol oxidase subunit II
VIAALVALAALTVHGAHYVALKTSGELNQRARRISAVLWPGLVLLTLVSLWATLGIRPELLANYKRYPFLFVIPVAVALSLMAMMLHRRRGNDKAAFLSSSAYLIMMMVGAAAALYPNLLVATTDPALNITVYNAAVSGYTLSVGLVVWAFGMALAVAYVIFIYRMFRGKVGAESAGGYH